MMRGEETLEMKNLVVRLAQAINHTLAESEEVHRVIEVIHREGFGAEVSVAACIGMFNPQDESDKPDTAQFESEMKFELDKTDLDFLKSLRLRIE